MKTEQIPPIFRLKTIYYILPFWLAAVFGLRGYVSFTDLGYYLKFGETMIEKKAVISQDIFTHTFFGLQYVNSGWLSQVLLAWCERLGGLESLVLLRVGILLLTMAIFYHLIRKQTKHHKITLLFIVFAATLGIGNWGIRPQLFIIPFFVFFYSYLFRKEKITNSSILLLSLLMILWVNLHSSFTLAIIMAGIFLLGRTADGYHDTGRYCGNTIKRLKLLSNDAGLRRLLLLVIVLTAVTLINPYGINIWKDVWANSSISAARSAEWQPTAMNDFTGYCFIVSVVLAGIIMKFSPRKVTWTEALLLLAFLFAGFKALRMVMWWGMVSAPILAAHFCSIEWVRRRISGEKEKAKAETECLVLNILFFIVFLISIIGFLPWFRPYLPIKSMRNIIDPRNAPAAIANYVKEEGLKGNMFNDINWGSYLIWKLWPEYKVFADNRLHLVPAETWKDYMDVDLGLADWEKILNKYNISFVVLSKKDNKRTIEFIGESQNWKKVYEDKAGAIFVRK